jgi:uncharacterized protein (TIGR02452 family)
MSSSEYCRRHALRQIAADTLAAINAGSYDLKNTVYSLHTKDAQRNTCFYPAHSLSNWSSPPTDQPTHSHVVQTYISILEISTLDCARLLFRTLRNNPHEDRRIGVLNFASATKPGGGFQNGAQAQEESIARSSTLSLTLLTDNAQNFYHVHKTARNPYYTHSIIYSPGVEVFRDDAGGWTKPLAIDVLTSAAVNAEEVRQSNRARHRGRTATEKEIECVMKERMARILFLFEEKGIRNLVLGSFGTGVFRNDVSVVARLWVELLSAPGARFRRSFDRVLFAILGRKTFVDFGNAFNDRTHD